jgi:hypothetical protein
MLQNVLELTLTFDKIYHAVANTEDNLEELMKCIQVNTTMLTTARDTVRNLFLRVSLSIRFLFKTFQLDS